MSYFSIYANMLLFTLASTMRGEIEVKNIYDNNTKLSSILGVSTPKATIKL